MPINEDLKKLLADHPLLESLTYETEGPDKTPIHHPLKLHEAILKYLDRPVPEAIKDIRGKVHLHYYNHRTRLARLKVLDLMDAYERSAGSFVEGHRLHLDHVFNVWILGLVLHRHVPHLRDAFGHFYRDRYGEYYQLMEDAVVSSVEAERVKVLPPEVQKRIQPINAEEQAAFRIFLYEWTMAAGWTTAFGSSPCTPIATPSRMPPGRSSFTTPGASAWLRSWNVR